VQLLLQIAVSISNTVDCTQTSYRQQFQSPSTAPATAAAFHGAAGANVIAVHVTNTAGEATWCKCKGKGKQQLSSAAQHLHTHQH
jgi:hypothetical protein